ncbi:hypothetical protein RND81_02G094900 [Saponaria officinalis]|uniref:Uncharacterized protein n=1 Tax=Saponaria officinalis TaxID=3572 RepID=A0AAW1MLR9_SAPOF
MEPIPVGKRTRNQTALNEKALCEGSKRVRPLVWGEHRKNNKVRADGGDKEDVKVVDEAEYLRRTSTSRGGQSSRNVDVGREDYSDDSVKIVGEKWNSSGVGFDDDDDDDDDVESSGDLGRDYQTQSMGVGSESSGDVNDDRYSSSEDDNYSDEDFKVNEAEISAFTSDYSSSDDYVKDCEWKEKPKTSKTSRVVADNQVDRNGKCRRKKNEAFLNEDKPVSRNENCRMNAGCSKRSWTRKKRDVGIESKSENNPLPEESGDSESDSLIHSPSSDSYYNNVVKALGRDEDCQTNVNEGYIYEEYVQWLSSINNRQIESDPENDPNPGTSVGRKRGRWPKNRKTGVQSKPKRGYLSEDSESYENGSFVRSSVPYYPCSKSLPREFGNSKNGGSKKRSGLSKGKKVVEESEHENFDKFDARSFVRSSSLPRKQGYQNRKYRKRDRSPKVWCYGKYKVDSESESESENFGGSENGGKRKGSKFRKHKNVTIKSTIKWINKFRK